MIFEIVVAILIVIALIATAGLWLPLLVGAVGLAITAALVGGVAWFFYELTGSVIGAVALVVAVAAAFGAYFAVVYYKQRYLAGRIIEYEDARSEQPITEQETLVWEFWDNVFGRSRRVYSTESRFFSGTRIESSGSGGRMKHDVLIRQACRCSPQINDAIGAEALGLSDLIAGLERLNDKYSLGIKFRKKSVHFPDPGALKREIRDIEAAASHMRAEQEKRKIEKERQRREDEAVEKAMRR